MDTSTIQQSEENESLIVHVDDTQNDLEDLEADFVASKTNKARMNTMNGSTEMEQTVEEKAENEIEETVKEKAKNETDEQQAKKKVRVKRDKSNIERPRNKRRWNLKITGLLTNTCIDELRRLCDQYGTVLGARIITKKRKSGGIQYHACVGMSEREEAEKCIEYLDRTEVDGNKIRVLRKPGRRDSQLKRLKTSQQDSFRSFQVGEQLRWERMKMENESLLKYDLGKQLLELNFRWTEVMRLNEMRHDMRRSRDQCKAYNRELWEEPIRPKQNSSYIPSIYDLPFPNQSRLEPQDQSNPRKEVLLNGPTRSKKANRRGRKGNSQIPSLFELPFENQSRANEYENKDYGKQVQHNDKRKGRVLEGGSHLDTRKQRQRTRQETVPFPDIQENVDRQIDDKLKLLAELAHSMQKPLNQSKRHEEEVWDEPKRPRMSNYNNTSRFQLPFQNESRRLEEMSHYMQRPREEELWDDPKRSRMSRYNNNNNNNNNTSRYDLPFQNESRYNEYDNTDYGRWADRKERETMRREMGPLRDFQGRNEMRNDGWSQTNEEFNRYNEYENTDYGRWPDRKDRETMRREMGPLRDFQGRNEMRNDDWSQTDDKFNRMAYDGRNDMGSSREPERYIGPNQEQDSDNRNISVSNRLGQMSSLGGGPDQRPTWGSSSVDRKVDNWSHMHGDRDNSSMNQSNDQWFGNSMNTTGRDASGAFVESGGPSNSGGLGHNQRSTNMFDNSQSQGGIMMNTYGSGNFGGNNMGGQMQQPYYNA